MSIEVIAGSIFIAFSGLVGIIYANLRGGIKQNKLDISNFDDKLDKYRDEVVDFKIEVVGRLTSLETLIRENGKDAL